MAKSILVVVTETDPKTGHRRQVASHGVNLDTGETFPVPWESPAALGARFDPELGEYVLQDVTS